MGESLGQDQALNRQASEGVRGRKAGWCRARHRRGAAVIFSEREQLRRASASFVGSDERCSMAFRRKQLMRVGCQRDGVDVLDDSLCPALRRLCLAGRQLARLTEAANPEHGPSAPVCAAAGATSSDSKVVGIPATSPLVISRRHNARSIYQGFGVSDRCVIVPMCMS